MDLKIKSKDFWLELKISTVSKVKAKNFRKIKRDNYEVYLTGYALGKNMELLPDIIFAQLVSSSVASIQEMNGSFCGVLITIDSVTVFSDRATDCKVYFSLQNRNIYISSNPDNIATKAPNSFDVDFTAWAEILKKGHLSQNRTMYKGIFSLSVGKVAVIKRRSESECFEWYDYDTVFGKGIIDDRPLSIIAQDIFSRLEECISNSHHFHQKKIAATLSAGLDSRLLVGIANNLGISIPLITIDTCLQVDEYELMKPLLMYLNLDCRNYLWFEGYLEAYAEKYWSEAGFHTNMHAWFAPAVQDRLHKKRWYMAGWGGDNLLRFQHIDERLAQPPALFKENEIIDILSTGSSPNMLFTTEFSRWVNEKYRECVEQSISPFLESPRGMKDWVLQTRFFNDVLLITTMYRKEFSSFSPFLCSNVLDLLLTLDTQHLGDDIYKALFSCFDSNLLSLPSTRSRLSDDFKRREFNNEPVLDWAYGKLQEGSLLTHAYLDKKKLVAYFETLKSSNRGITPLLRATLALNFWFEQFNGMRKNISVKNSIFTHSSD